MLAEGQDPGDELVVPRILRGEVAAGEPGRLVGPKGRVRRIPQRRLGTQAEAVEAVLFLLGGARYTTGEVLRVDGGRALN